MIKLIKRWFVCSVKGHKWEVSKNYHTLCTVGKIFRIHNCIRCDKNKREYIDAKKT